MMLTILEGSWNSLDSKMYWPWHVVAMDDAICLIVSEKMSQKKPYLVHRKNITYLSLKKLNFRKHLCRSPKNKKVTLKNSIFKFNTNWREISGRRKQFDM